jgi:hypothetical protein
VSTSRKAGEAFSSLELSRRQLLRGAGVVVGAALLPLRAGRAGQEFALPEATRKALETSSYVYVSPLHPDGKESRCHGEVWYSYDKGDVVIATGNERWKTRAVERGWTRTRIWVGDYGRVKSDGDRFRTGPSFLAEARHDRDRAAFERLMARFGKKYPDEWEKWEPRFRKGYAEGSRVLIRYRPIGS